MAEDADWIPPGIDMTKASPARVYDWWLGGEHNFRVDQDAARALIAVEPGTRVIARAYRAFLIRAVRYLAAEAGIRQFLDIGSGIPTAQNVHQVAQEAAPGSRVVYADSDDVAVAHSRLLLQGNPDATVIHADLRDPQSILDHPETRRLLDFTRPVAVLLSAVLHFIPDTDEPQRILAALREPLAPGSYLAISHACRDAVADNAPAYESAYSSRVAATVTLRSTAEITRFFDGLTLLDPGVTWVPRWRPDSPGDIPDAATATDRSATLWGVAGVGMKTG